MAAKVIKNIEGKLAGKSFQSLLQMRGKFGSVPSTRLYKKEVLRAVADSDPNMHKAIYGGNFDPHVAGKTFTKALQHVHSGEGKLELTEKARRMLGLKKDQEIKGGKEEMVTKKLVTFFRKEAASAEPDTGPSALDLKLEARRREVNILTGRSLRLRAEAGGKKASGFANPNAQAGYAGGQHENAGGSAIVRSKDVQTSVTGEVKYAGKDTPATAIPGQHVSPPATPLQSRGSVQLAGGIGLSQVGGRPADRADELVIPHIVGAADVRGQAPASNAPEAAKGTEKNVPTPGLKTEVTDISSLKDSKKDADDELPSTEDINKNLPLAA